MYNWNNRRRRKNKNGRKNIWVNNGWEFFKINDWHKTANPGSLENIKNEKYQKSTPKNIFKLQKTKYREKILKEAGVGEILFKKEQI